MTLRLALTALVLATALGLVAAWLRLDGGPWARRLASTYTTLVRGLPDLVLMLMLYYGGQAAVNAATAWLAPGSFIELDAFTAGALAIGLILGGSMAETFRGAWLALAPGQTLGARALGLRDPVTFGLVLLPQLVPLALPSFTNNWLVLLKMTALASVLGLDDLLRQAALAAAATREPFTFYLAVALAYLVLTAASGLALRWIARRSAVGAARAAR